MQAFLVLEPEAGTAVPIELEPLLLAAAKEAAEQNQGAPLELVCEPLPVLEGYREDLETLFPHLLHALSFSEVPQPIHIDSCILKENVFKSIPDKYHYDDAVRLTFRVKSLRFDLGQMQDFLTRGTKLTREWEQVSFNLALCRKLIDHHRGSVSLGTSPEGGPQVIVLLPLKQ